MTTEAFFARRREGPHRFSEKRPRSFVSSLGKIAAAETSKNPHLREFWGRSIFDFFNNIDPKRTLATLWDLLQRNIKTADVRSELDAHLGPLQVEPHTFSIP